MADGLRIHFETRAGKPDVFRFTADLIAAAKERAHCREPTSLGADLSDLSWLPHCCLLATSNDVIRDEKFPIDRLARAAPKLRCIHIIGAGIEPLLPLDWLPPGIALTNNSGVHGDKAYESAMMVLLMLHARVPHLVTNQRQGTWEQAFTPRIKGKTALIVGVGDMGAAAAAAARNLGVKTLGVRRRGLAHPLIDEMFAIERLDAALPRADFIVLAAPLTPATHHLLDRRRFQLLKRGAGLFNVGRAGLVDHTALAESLADGRLSGAVTDVFDKEPLERDSPLWHVPNLITLPHVTSDDLDAYLPKTLDLVFENVRRLRQGEALLNVVDREQGY
jgi:phosphoglycerate dehydrogenase-like enzyme